MNTVKCYAKLLKVDTTLFAGIHLEHKILSASQKKRIRKESENVTIQNSEA